MQDQQSSINNDDSHSLSMIKLLLQKAWPHLLIKLKSGDYDVPKGHVHIMSINPSEGLVWKTLQKSQVIEEINFVKTEVIKNLTIDLFKVCPYLSDGSLVWHLLSYIQLMDIIIGGP